MNSKYKVVCVFITILLSVLICIKNYKMYYQNKRLTLPGYIKTKEQQLPVTSHIYSKALTSIRKTCGELCDTSRKGRPGPFFDHVTANVNCNGLLKNAYIDRSHGLTHAPKSIPSHLKNAFTMNNSLPLRYAYYSQIYLGRNASTPVWKKAHIENLIAYARNGTLHGNYGQGETNSLRDGLAHASGIKKGRVLVIGSENPWVEACVLEAGAREVVTLEYGRIISEHPQIRTMVPDDFRMRFLNHSLENFDAIVTFSSVEHSGLGRYGDALNPWGDIIAIARAWCVTKKGGALVIGVMYTDKNDYITFNAHRVYGKHRYPYLTTNWKQIYRGKGLQRVHVFKKVM